MTRRPGTAHPICGGQFGLVCFYLYLSGGHVVCFPGYSTPIQADTWLLVSCKNHIRELLHSLPYILFTGDHSRLTMMIYAPRPVYDDKVKADLAEGVTLVANQDPEPEPGR